MNDTAAFLWKKVENLTNFSTRDLINILMDEYDVDADTAESDVKKLLEQWSNAGLLE